MVVSWLCERMSLSGLDRVISKNLSCPIGTINIPKSKSRLYDDVTPSDLMVNRFDAHSITGLSDREAAYRLKQEGYNELPSTRRRSILAIAAEVLQEP